MCSTLTLLIIGFPLLQGLLELATSQGQGGGDGRRDGLQNTRA
jgi:hypothetical protein